MKKLILYAPTALIAATYLALSIADGGSKVLLVSASTAVVWWAVIVGLAFGILPRARVPARAIVSAASLAALAIFAAISMAWASNDGNAFLDVLRIVNYLGLLLLVVLVSPRGSARLWLAGLAIGLALLAAFALASRFEPSLPGGEENIATFLADASGRLSYPIGYWNALGACMAIGAVLLAWLGANGATRIGRALSTAAIPLCGLALYMTSSAGAAVAVTLGAAALLLLGPARPRLVGTLALGGAGAAALVVLVRSRNDLVDAVAGPTLESQGDEMLAFTLAAMLVVALLRFLFDAPLGRLRVTRGLAIASGAAAIVAVIALAIAIDPISHADEFCEPPPQQQLVSQNASSDISRLDSSGRCQYWEVAIDGFASDPATGVGAGGYEQLWNRNAPFTRKLTHAHSLFFENLAELGLPGLLLVFGFLVPAGYAVWRPGLIPDTGGEFGAAAAVLVTGIVSATVEWTFEFPSSFIPTVVAVALLTGVALYRPSRAGALDDRSATVEMERADSSGRGFGWGVATLAVGWASIIVAAIVFFTEAKLVQSESAAGRSELEEAAQDARDAANLQPWAAEPWTRLALIEELSGDLAGAQEAIREASERAPEDWQLWLINARFDVGLDDLEGARVSLDRARELWPKNQIFQRREAIPASQQQFQASLESGALGKDLGIEQSEEQQGQATAPATNPKDAGIPGAWSVSWR